MAISAWSFLLVLFFSAVAGPARAQSKAPSTVPLLHSRSHLLIVSARLNGRGPYKFILDTGSNVSLIESSLFRDLGLRETGHPSAKVIDWMALGKLAIAEEISIEGGPSGKDIRVLEVDGIKRQDIDPSVRGVLGENFLSGFDLLIDNRHGEITFDAGNSLAASLDGERIALDLTANVRGVQVKNRPLVSARVSSFDENRPLRLLLDTGSEGINLVSREGNRPEAGRAAVTSMALLGEGSACVHWKDRLQLGKTTTSKVKMTSCMKSSAGSADNDGTLPTSIFDRIFIGHAGGYLILNPVDARRADSDSQH